MTKPTFAIVKTELTRRKLYTLFWGLGIAVLSAFTVLAYSAVKNQADQLNKAFSSFTSSAGSFFGTSDMFSPVGYLNSQLYYIVLPILFIILGIALSSALISKEERGHTLELLLSRPISRTKLLLAKIITAVIIFAVLGIVTFIAIAICGKAAGLGIPAGRIALTTLMMTLFAGAFGAIAFTLYAASQKTGRIAAVVAILLSLGGYIISSIGSMVHGLSWLAKLFPYHYYNPGAILHGQVSKGLIIYLAAVYVICLVLALAGFHRRDIA